MVPAEGMREGTATELIKQMTAYVEEDVRRSQAWPKGPQAFSSRLRRLGPSLRSMGIEVHSIRFGHNRTRIIRIERGCKSPSSLSSSSAALMDVGILADDADNRGQAPLSSSSA